MRVQRLQHAARINHHHRHHRLHQQQQQLAFGCLLCPRHGPKRCTRIFSCYLLDNLAR